MKSPRIAYLTSQYPRATDTFIQREVAALRKLGMTIETFAMRDPGSTHEVGPEQISERAATTYLLGDRMAMLQSVPAIFLRSPIRFLRAARLAYSTKRAGFRGALYQLIYFAEAGRLAHQIKRRDLDHIHNHIGESPCTVAMLAAEMTGVPYSFTLHGPGIFFDPQGWRIDEKIRRASFVACISYFCRSQASIFSNPDDWYKLHIVHCGVDAHRVQTSQTTGCGSEILFVARLDELKGLTVLLEAMVQVRAQHPTVRLRVVGDGDARDSFEKRAKRYGLAATVDFVGYKSQDEVAALLGETDVFVLPSFAEGVPVSLMEALAAAVPVIATNVGGVTELVEDQVNGFVVRPGDVGQLAERINELLSDGERRAKLGTTGRAKVEEQFDSLVEASRLRTLFEDTHRGIPVPTRPGTRLD